MPIVVLCVNCVVLKNQFSRPQFSLEAGNMHPKVKNEEVGDWTQRRRFPARPFMDLFDCGNLDQMHLVLILYILHWTLNILHSRQRIKKEGTRPRFCQIVGIWRRIHFLSLFVSRDASKFDAHIYIDWRREEFEGRCVPCICIKMHLALMGESLRFKEELEGVMYHL